MKSNKFKNEDFVHLHVHSEYSAFDGLSPISKLALKARKMNFKALGLTDHGNIGGLIKFIKECTSTKDKKDNAIEFGKIKPIIGCLVKGQEIITSTGVKNVEDICVGDMVLTHKGRYRKVIRIMKRIHEGIFYKVKLAHGVKRELVLTEEHPIFIRDNSGNYSWKKPKEIVFGTKNKKYGIKNWNSYVCFPKSKIKNCKSVDIKKYLPDYLGITLDHVSKIKKANKYDCLNEWKNIKEFTNIDEDFSYFLGLFCSEGWTQSKDKQGTLNGTFGLSFHVEETDFINFCVNFLKEKFNIDAKIYEKKDKHQTDVVACCLPLAYLFSGMCGRKSLNKKIPEEIFISSDDNKKMFLKGVIDGDGKDKDATSNIYKQSTLRVRSRDFAWGFKCLCANFGHWNNVHYKTKNGSECYTVPLNEDRRYSRSLEDDDYICKPIKEIVSYSEKCDVFNFEVEEDNSYVSDFILHNCEFYLARKMEWKNKELQPEGRKGNRHLCLFAKNFKGYQNLCTLSEMSWVDGFYTNPRIDLENLAKYSEGLLCSSACLSSLINANLLHDRYDAAKRACTLFKDIFGRDFYLEVMYHGIDAEASIIPDIIKLGKELEIPLIATNDCFEPGTFISTKSGVKPIEDIKIGEYVITEKNRLKKVLFVNKRKSDSIYDVKSVLGTKSFSATENHPVFVVSKKDSTHFTEPYYKNVGDLNINDYLLIIKNNKNLFNKNDMSSLCLKELLGSEFDKYIEGNYYTTVKGFNKTNGYVRVPIELKIDDDFCYMIGRYIAEGNTDSYSGKISFAGNIKEIDIQKRIVKYFEQFGCQPQLVIDGNAAKVIFSSVVWKGILNNLVGDGSENKHLPVVKNSYYCWSKNQIKNILIGYIIGDGHIPTVVNRSGVISATTSKVLSYQISDILRQFGLVCMPTIRTKFSNHKNKKANVKNWLPLYVIHLSPSDNEQFSLIFDIETKSKNTSCSRRKFIDIGDFYAIKIKSVTKRNYNNDVFNLQVEDDETYIANGYVVHNCHYLEKQDSTSHEVLMCMSTSKCLSDPKHLHFPYGEFYLKSAEEMGKIFGHIPQSIYNTVAFAESIDSEDMYKNMFGGMRLPKFKVPENYTQDFEGQYKYLRDIAYDGLKGRGWGDSEEHKNTLEKELNDIRVAYESNKYNFAEYFLIEQDIMDFASKSGILTGPGRGSGYASVLLHCIGVAYGVDPLKYNLLWERFLGFDSKRFIKEDDFGIEEDIIEKLHEKEELSEELAEDESMEDDDRDTEDDLGGVDRY